MAALAVVEDFDVVEDLGALLGLRRPGAAVDELFLEGREVALGDGVVEAVAPRLRKQHSEPERTDRRRFAAPFPQPDHHHVRFTNYAGRLINPCPPKRGNSRPQQWLAQRTLQQQASDDRDDQARPGQPQPPAEVAALGDRAR